MGWADRSPEGQLLWAHDFADGDGGARAEEDHEWWRRADRVKSVWRATDGYDPQTDEGERILVAKREEVKRRQPNAAVGSRGPPDQELPSSSVDPEARQSTAQDHLFPAGAGDPTSFFDEKNLPEDESELDRELRLRETRPRAEIRDFVPPEEARIGRSCFKTLKNMGPAVLKKSYLERLKMARALILHDVIAWNERAKQRSVQLQETAEEWETNRPFVNVRLPAEESWERWVRVRNRPEQEVEWPESSDVSGGGNEHEQRTEMPAGAGEQTPPAGLMERGMDTGTGSGGDHGSAREESGIGETSRIGGQLKELRGGSGHEEHPGDSFVSRTPSSEKVEAVAVSARPALVSSSTSARQEHEQSSTPESSSTSTLPSSTKLPSSSVLSSLVATPMTRVSSPWWTSAPLKTAVQTAAKDQLPTPGSSRQLQDIDLRIIEIVNWVGNKTLVPRNPQGTYPTWQTPIYNEIPVPNLLNDPIRRSYRKSPSESSFANSQQLMTSDMPDIIGFTIYNFPDKSFLVLHQKKGSIWVYDIDSATNTDVPRDPPLIGPPQPPTARLRWHSCVEQGGLCHLQSSTNIKVGALILDRHRLMLLKYVWSSFAGKVRIYDALVSQSMARIPIVQEIGLRNEPGRGATGLNSPYSVATYIPYNSTWFLDPNPEAFQWGGEIVSPWMHMADQSFIFVADTGKFVFIRSDQSFIFVADTGKILSGPRCPVSRTS